VLISNEWYPMFRRANVELVTAGVREITETGIVTDDGVERPVDCIVLGTGFIVDPRIYMQRFPVTGLPGHVLADDWRTGAEAYYGISVAGYPNLHQLVGPNTALGHNSIIFMIEAQVHYVLQCLRALREQGADWLSVEPQAQVEFNVRLQAALRGTVWTTGCRSWYQQDDGKNFTIWPWSTWRYWRETRRIDPGRYRFGKAGAIATAAAVAAASLATTACSDRTTPEQQVRAVVAAAEDAAERRDHGDLVALVSPRFEGAHGEDLREVSQLLRGYLVTHPSIHVATRIESIEFPYDDMARVSLTVGSLGSGTTAAGVAVDTQDVELELQREDGDWLVTRAAWE
jgi:hypothetical protein